MLTRGTFTCGLNQLLQSHLTSPQAIDTHNLRRVANVSPTINVHGDDSSYSGLTVSCNSPLELAHVDLSNGNLNDGMWWCCELCYRYLALGLIIIYIPCAPCFVRLDLANVLSLVEIFSPLFSITLMFRLSLLLWSYWQTNI